MHFLFVSSINAYKCHIINFLLTSVRIEKYRTSVFLYKPRPTPYGLGLSKKNSVRYFIVQTSRSVNKKLIMLTLSVILCDRCFDPVWRLNLVAINLKNMHRNKLIQILYGVSSLRESSKFPLKLFRIQNFWTRHETEKIYYRICRCVCKQQHESGTKTFRYGDDESENQGRN
jgi:hypothetical protein